MSTNGLLEVHDNVVFRANTAEEDGGAVRPPLEIGFQLARAVFCDMCCEARVGSIC